MPDQPWQYSHAEQQVGPTATTERPAAVPPPLPPMDNTLPYAAVAAHSIYPPAPDLGQSAGMRMLLPVGRSGMAIVAGYLGLFSLLILPAPVALFASIYAIYDIRKNPGKHGMGRAIFGLIMGLLGTGLLLFALYLRMNR